jgi:hypothetical protein
MELNAFSSQELIVAQLFRKFPGVYERQIRYSLARSKDPAIDTRPEPD